MFDSYSIATYNGLDVAWTAELDGGGQAYGQGFIPLIEQLFGRVGHVYEPCSGCGFIAFSLLAHGLCDRLTLSDINPDAVVAILETIRRNDLADKVEVYLADGLTGIPASRRFDLVVSNPPWYTTNTGSLITDDPDWGFHRRFYARIADYLTTGASIIFRENSGGAEPEIFLPMLAAGGLAHIQTLRHSEDPNPANYFLWSKPLPEHLIPRPMAVPESVVLELGTVATEHELQAGLWYRGMVVNHVGRPIDLILSGADGDALCLPMETDSTMLLPSFLLPPGDYRLRDGLTDSLLLTIKVQADPR